MKKIIIKHEYAFKGQQPSYMFRFMVKPSLKYVQKLKDKTWNTFITNNLHLAVNRGPSPHVSVIIYSSLQAHQYAVKDIYSVGT